MWLADRELIIPVMAIGPGDRWRVVTGGDSDGNGMGSKKYGTPYNPAQVGSVEVFIETDHREAESFPTCEVRSKV